MDRIDGPLSVIVRQPENYGYRPNYEFPQGATPDFFVYQFPVVSNLAVDANVSVSVQIQNDADFEMRSIGYFFNLADAAFTQQTRPVPNMTLMLTDTGSGRNLFSAAVPIPTIAWNGEGSMRELPWPKIFSRNANISALVTNFDAAATTGQMYLSLIGRKIFTGKPLG